MGPVTAVVESRPNNVMEMLTREDRRDLVGPTREV